MTSQIEVSDRPAPPSEPGVGPAELARLSELATLVTAAQDAMSDDIVTRLSAALNEGMILLDRLTRNQALMRLLHTLERAECQNLLEALAEALAATSRDLAKGRAADGGLGGWVRLLRDPDTCETLRLVSVLGSHLSRNLQASRAPDSSSS